jgi:hypothetical protein
MFDDLGSLNLDPNSKQVKLEAAIRSGQFTKKNMQGGKENTASVNRSFSSSSSDEAEEEADQVNELSEALKKVNTKMDDAAIEEIKRRHSVQINKHYMALEGEELLQNKITGLRLTTAKFSNSKACDICMIVLTIIYTILVLIILSFGESFYDDNPDAEIAFHIIELIILLIFCVDIVARIYSFRMLYLKDYLNIIDITTIILAIILAIIDMSVDNSVASALLRIRGMFRITTLLLLVRKLNEVKGSNKAKKKSEISYSEFKSPLERTLEIMTALRECLEDQKFVRDINYCIKNISNGKLYDKEVKDSEQVGLGALRRSRRGGILAMEENLWIRSCSSASNPRKVARLSRSSSVIITLSRKSSALQQKMNISNAAKKIFENVENLDFNIFEFKEEVKNNELICLCNMLMEKHDLFKSMKINSGKFLNFTKTIQSNYKKVQYHNKTHGTDVAQTLYCFLMKGDWMNRGKMDNFDLFSMIVGGCVHDYEHPGYNAAFLMKTNDKLAVRYNDISVLENHHVAATFEVINLTENNIFEKVPLEEKNDIRKMMIEMILSTDMSKHFADLGKFKSRVSTTNFDPAESDKQLCMNMGMHIADISNPSKKWDISYKWTEWLYEEFFAQGDKERELGMQISDLMDRTTINCAKSSIGFIDVIVEPAYVAFQMFQAHLKENIENIKSNKAKWQNLIGDYQEKVEKAQKFFKDNPPKVLIEEDEDEDDDSNASSSSHSFQQNNDSVNQGGLQSSVMGSMESKDFAHSKKSSKEF